MVDWLVEIHRIFKFEVCDVWRKLVNWLVEVVVKNDVSNAGREVESAVEEKS